MTVTNIEPASESMGRIDGLLKWWGIDQSWGSGSVSQMTAQLQNFISMLQSIYADSWQHQYDIMNDANEHFSTAFKAVMRSQSPGEALEAEMALLRTVAADVSAQCRGYMELVGKLHACIEQTTHEASFTADKAKKIEPQKAQQRVHSLGERAVKHADPV